MADQSDKLSEGAICLTEFCLHFLLSIPRIQEYEKSEFRFLCQIHN